MKSIAVKIFVFLTILMMCVFLFSGCATTSTGPVSSWKNVSFTTMGTAYIRALYFDGSTYFAAGDQGQMARSSNGISWTAVRSDFGATRIQAIIQGNGTYVAVGDESKISISQDGTTWTSVSGSPICLSIHLLLIRTAGIALELGNVRAVNRQWP